jgi:hypothetical protein
MEFETLINLKEIDNNYNHETIHTAEDVYEVISGAILRECELNLKKAQEEAVKAEEELKKLLSKYK